MLWYIRPSIVTVGEALDWLETCVSCAVVEAVVAALLCFDGFPPMVKNEKEGEEEEERCLYFFLSTRDTLRGSKFLCVDGAQVDTGLIHSVSLVNVIIAPCLSFYPGPWA